MDLSIVVPIYNERANIEELYFKIEKEMKKLSAEYEVIFIDDGSTDATWEAIEQLKKKSTCFKAIKLKRNYGQTAAMVAGFDESKGSIIITLDGDMQNDPSDISALLKKLDEGYDIVSGWRKNRKDGFLRVILSKIANALISLTTGVRLHDYGCTIKAYRSECLKPLKIYGEMHRFLPALASMTGARVTEIPVHHNPRKFGSSKYGFDRVFSVISDIIAMNLIISFSSKPLQGFVLCAFPFLLLGLGFGILSGIAIIVGWTEGKSLTFMISMALNFMAVLHLIALGIIGELVVSTSDLSHTQMPEVTKKALSINGMQNDK